MVDIILQVKKTLSKNKNSDKETLVEIIFNNLIIK
jgi:hypothetical protein